MGGKKPLRRPLWPPTRATASNYYPLGLDGAGGAAKPLLRAPKKPAPLHGRLPAFSGAVDAFERARKCFLEWRYFFSIILSEFLKNRVALHFIIAKITPCMENGKCAIAEGLTNGIGFGSSEFHTFRCHASEILTKFLFLLLNQTTVRKAAEDAMTGASGHRRVPAAFYEEMLIPVPPIPVQQQVIDECAKIDEEYNATRMSIETYRQKTADLFAELDAVMSTTEGNRLSLSDTEKFSVAIGKRVLDKELASNGTIPVYSANVTAPFGFIDKLLITDFSAPSVLWGIDGDWMTSYLPSDMPFYPTDHCGVLRCKNSEVNPRYLAHILEVEGRKMGFSRSYRASIDRVHGIAFTVPDISIQNNAMSKVADYEMAIKELEGSLEKIASRRSEIIRKALAE